MLRQDIVIDPEIFHIIGDKIINDDFNSYTYKANMAYKKLLLDKDFLVLDRIQYFASSNNHASTLFQKMLDNFLIEGGFEYIDISDIKNSEQIDKLLFCLLALCKKSESKIIHSERKNDINKIRNSTLKIKKCEILGINDFENPNSRSKIFNQERRFTFYKGENIHLDYVFKYYLANTTRLLICDKYIVNRYSGFRILMKILKFCKQLEAIEIWSDFDAMDKNNVTSIEMASSIKEIITCDIRLYNSNRDMHDRNFYTDTHSINSGIGLNFLDAQYNVTKQTVYIDIKLSDADSNINLRSNKLEPLKKNSLRYHEK